MLELLGVAALVFGLFFSAVGVIGVIRLPDVLTRLHASGKVAVLGMFGLLLGAALLMPSSALRLLTLGLFVLLTSPVATHAIAAAMYRRQRIAQQLAQDARQSQDEEAASEREAPQDPQRESPAPADSPPKPDQPEPAPAPVPQPEPEQRVDVTAVLTRSRIQDIIEAQERAARLRSSASDSEDDA